MIYKENSLTYETYYALRESVGWNNFNKKQAIKALNQSVYDIVIYDEEKAVGMGRLIGDGVYYTIVDVCIDPLYQNKKIGTKIIKRILEFATKDIKNDMRVSVQLISAKGKEGFYEKLGFSKIPNDTCGSGMIYKINY